MLITGTAVFAAFSRGSFESTDLGNGAVLPAPVLSQPSPQTGCARPRTCDSFALLRYRPGTDLRAAAARLIRLTTHAGCPPGSCVVISDQRPDDIRNYSRVRDTPLVLGGVLALLAVGTLAHVLVTAVRRRRRDLAMLKTLRLVRRQVLGVVEWQALSLAGVALLIGVPLGLLAGRWAWVLFASSAGLAPAVSIPVTLVLLIIPVTLVLAALIAAWPGRAAAPGQGRRGAAGGVTPPPPDRGRQLVFVAERTGTRLLRSLGAQHARRADPGRRPAGPQGHRVGDDQDGGHHDQHRRDRHAGISGDAESRAEQLPGPSASRQPQRQADQQGQPGQDGDLPRADLADLTPEQAEGLEDGELAPPPRAAPATNAAAPPARSRAGYAAMDRA